MKSEIANMSEKLDTLVAQRETDDEGQFWIKAVMQFLHSKRTAYPAND